MTAFTILSDDLREAARRLARASDTGVPCAPIRDLVSAGGVDAAYAVQKLVSDAAIAAGRRRVGCKIGLTSPSVQRQLGVDQPDFGLLFADMEVDNGGEVAPGRLLQPRCEVELAFILGADLDEAQLISADVLRAIDWVLPAIEIVDSRIAGWDITLVDTVADNASSGAFVLGHEARSADEVDFLLCGMTLEKDGQTVSTGVGAACLGSPVNAALWLARTMAKMGEPLRRGDLILTGALGPMIAAAPGDSFAARIEGVGSVSVNFAEIRR